MTAVECREVLQMLGNLLTWREVGGRLLGDPLDILRDQDQPAAELRGRGSCGSLRWNRPDRWAFAE